MMKPLIPLAALAALTACSTLPPPFDGPAGGVANTSWRVTAVNGRPTPPNGDFSMAFERATFGSRFGCNGMGADYVQRGSLIDGGPLRGTLMACPDMSYENQARAILERDMVAAWNGPNWLSLSNSAGSIQLQR